MAEAIYDDLGPAVTRWTMGGAAISVAPSDWRPHLAADAAEAELRLLALAGHFLGTVITPEPAGALTAQPDLPRLDLPSLDEPLRPLARRILRATRDVRVSRELLRFLARRGRTLHPGDWMPKADEEDLPDVYAPWRDWALGATSATGGEAAEGLTAETWPDYWPAARNVAFAALRRRDPAAAVTLLAAKLTGEAAETRLRLVGPLATRLSDADRGFLESLSTDRAPKVKALAAALLARLGHAQGAGQEAEELAGFFELQTRGLLRRTRLLAAKPLKTPAQRSRRHSLFEAVDLSGFAAALALPAEDMIALWPWSEDREADHGLIGMAERSGADDLVGRLHAALLGLGTADVAAMLTLAPRLDQAQRREFARKVLRAGGGTFQMALAITGGEAGIPDAIDSAAGQALLAALKTDEGGRRADLTAELHALGLIATQKAAHLALDRLARAGLLAADPRMDMLRLNAALDCGEVE